jgi:stage 0 DNA-binding protein
VEKKLSVREVEKRSQEQTVQKKKKKPLSGQLSSIFKDLEEKMRENLGTKVKIIPKNENKGKLEIEYYSQEDLERIYVLLEGKAKG